MNLRRTSFVLISSCLILALLSCGKHRRQIRVKNSFSAALNVKIGPADFGSVGSVKTTDYKDIAKGTNEITGDVPGSITVPSGKHKYTLNINTVGVVTLIEDNK